MSYFSPWQRSVYILGDGFLFDEIIVHMLASDSKLHLVRRIYEDQAVFLTDVSRLQPDVILLHETDRFDCQRLLLLLLNASLPDDLRVIAISLKSNFIKIFDQPADPLDGWDGVAYTLKRIGSWNEVFDLIGGKQLVWNRGMI